MDRDFFENKDISPNTFKIGMVSTILFIFINILSALTTESPGHNPGFPGVIRLVIYYFLYASIWYTMRDVLVKVLRLAQLFNVTTWMLRLVIISGLFTLAVDAFDSENVMLLFFLVGLALLGFFINFMIRVMQIDYREIPQIKHLRHFVISFIILFVILMVIEVIQFQLHYNLKLISNLLYVVPFLFLYFFFKEVKAFYFSDNSS